MNRSAAKLVVTTALATAALTLSGCNLQQTARLPIGGQPIQGTVYGGQQAIVGATVQLYAAGATGYGSAALALIKPAVTTGTGGSFSIKGDFTCPSSTAEVYLVATGGNPGTANPNPNIALMAALGPCGNLGTNTHIILNELTTVGSVWALSGFMTGIANIGTSATNNQGLVNAFNTVNNLVDTSTGNLSAPPLLPSNATLPASKLNLIADILAACVNSPGGTAGDKSNCGNLFQYTQAGNGGVAPTDTITAAMVMAQHPNNSVPQLSGLPAPSAPFQPAAGSVPDFNLSIVYTGGGLSSPKAIAADSNGNIWLANYGNNSITELASNGAAVSGANGFTGGLNLPYAIAIDTGNNVWVTNHGTTNTNTGLASVTEFSSAGSINASYSDANYTTPSGIAIDSAGNVWVHVPYYLSQIVPGTGIANDYPTVAAQGPLAIDPK